MRCVICNCIYLVACRRAIEAGGSGGYGNGDEGSKAQLGEAEHGAEDGHAAGECGEVYDCMFRVWRGGSVCVRGIGGVGVEVAI